MNGKLKTGLIGALVLATASLMPLDANAAAKRSSRKPKASVTAAVRPYQTNYENLKNDSPAVLVARALMGEVDNCPEQEIFYVLGTIQSRVDDGIAWNGADVKSVLLKKWQYCAFNGTPDNRKNLSRILNPMSHEPERFKYFLRIGEAFTSGQYAGQLPIVTHYYEKSLDENGGAPSWANDSQFYEVEMPKQFDNFRHKFFFDNRALPGIKRKIAQKANAQVAQR